MKKVIYKMRPPFKNQSKLSAAHTVQQDIMMVKPYELEMFEITGNDIDFKQVMIDLQDEVKVFAYWLATEGEQS